MILQFKTICLLACLLEKWFNYSKTIYLLACMHKKWFNNSKTIYLLACLKNGLILQNHLLACLLEKWFNTSKPFAYLLAFQKWFKSKPFACFSTKGMIGCIRTITCFLNSLFALQYGFKIKTMKYQCKTVYIYIYNIIAFEKMGLEHSPLCLLNLRAQFHTFPHLYF